jgi:hypothetical protein
MQQRVGLATVPAATGGGTSECLLSVIGVMSCQGLPNLTSNPDIALPELAAVADSDGPTARARAEG